MCDNETINQAKATWKTSNRKIHCHFISGGDRDVVELDLHVYIQLCFCARKRKNFTFKEAFCFVLWANE